VPGGLRRVPLWVWWIPVVFAASAPLAPTGTPQWHRVHALPFSDPDDKVTDLAVNVLLFLPFGYSFARSAGRTALVLPVAAATSIGAEAMQVFSMVRNPSGTDVVYAMVGAVVGAAAARMFRTG
jgi:glycopeptide antibiotics resistance protein